MKVLIACEESRRVCIEFRKRGHEAYSCDIEPCSDGHPEWHLQCDVIEILKMKWDMIIAFPPCTYLTNAGTRHFSLKCSTPEKIEKRIKLRKDAAEFFMRFVNADCEKIAIENPVGYMNSSYRKADQIIHPYYFAENEDDTENYHQKRTCIWLKGLPTLQKISDLKKPSPLYICKGKKCNGKAIGWCEGMRNIKGGQSERAKARSKTFPGIAKAMAEQWG